MIDIFQTNKIDMTNEAFKFIDLFSGIGGMRIPFDEIGGTCVFSSENDQYSQKTYESFFGERPDGDITQIDISTIPKFDILLAGFPCQPFSNAGLRKGLDDKRGNLFFNIKAILNKHKPKAFLLENVPGLNTHDNQRTIKKMHKELSEIGYEFDSKILAAKDFNLPQRRRRLYMVAFKNKRLQKKFMFPEIQTLRNKFKNIMEKKPDSKYTISDKLWIGHQERKKRNKKRGVGFGYAIFDENSEFVNTISARYNKDGSEILIAQKNKNPRKLTPLEAARLQGFPDKIVKRALDSGVSEAQLYKQFGNAVPINVVRAISKNMMKVLFNNAK